MRLLNVSAGRVRNVNVGGQDVPTAHVKTPVAGDWLIDGNGVVGDERAVHPDKLYAFAHGHYDFWAAYLDADRDAWPDGFFGENLTFDQLDEEEIRVGDEFALGDEVRLVVTGARTPCAKLAWRMGQPLAFLHAFSLSKRVGVYFGIVTTGRVRPRDRLVRVATDPLMPTLAELCGFIHHRAVPPLESLRHVLAFDRLSPTARLLLGAKLEAAERAAATAGGRWRGWRAFVVDAIRDEAPGIRSFQFRAADGERLAQPEPGQFVTVRLHPPGADPVTRSWSLSDFGYDSDRYRITVKRQNGPGSTKLHALRVGDRVELRAPAGNFVLDMGSFRPIALVAAGIGITPLHAMLKAHVTRRAMAPVRLFYGARTQREAALRDEIEALVDATPAASLHYRFSREAEVGGAPSRITADDIIAGLDGQVINVGGKTVTLPWYECEIYLCGPDDFCRSLTEELIARGGSGDRIRFELFSTPELIETEIERADIRFAKSGKAAVWVGSDELSLLELAEQAGIDAAYDCRAGSCQTCRVPIVMGGATATVEDGALICIARPTTAELVLDL